MRKDKDCAVSRKWWMISMSFVISYLSFSISACSSIDCPVQNSVRTVYQLYTADAQVDTLRDTLYVTSRRIDGTDTLLLNAGIGMTNFSLTVSYSSPEDTLHFLMTNGSDYKAFDTVYVKKENYPHFESVDCGTSFFHKLTAVRSTHNAIDTIVINKSNVDYDDQTAHFHIRFKSRH